MKHRSCIATVLTVVSVLFVLQPAQFSYGAQPTPEPEIKAAAGNLLKNPSMEEGFYWKYPNHFVANEWRRWWVGDVIPEYDDVREWRPWTYDGKHAQVYFWYWNIPYTAGIFQQVQVQPCTLHQFSMYGRNHSQAGADHRARIGIDPLGRTYGLYMTSLPTDIVWSPEQTYFYEWGPHTVTAESLGQTLTAITHVSPDPDKQPYDTFWDVGDLFPLPFPDDLIPEPDSWKSSSFIYNVTTQQKMDDLIIEWDTRHPASSQVWYTITPYSPPPP
ncbi:MAG TPA: hypothetical protein ENN99_06805, partial [Chloroflexi bacterium]|nr:hypothetical protein [Chloroflexota bacterium]